MNETRTAPCINEKKRLIFWIGFPLCNRLFLIPWKGCTKIDGGFRGEARLQLFGTKNAPTYINIKDGALTNKAWKESNLKVQWSPAIAEKQDIQGDKAVQQQQQKITMPACSIARLGNTPCTASGSGCSAARYKSVLITTHIKSLESLKANWTNHYMYMKQRINCQYILPLKRNSQVSASSSSLE